MRVTCKDCNALVHWYANGRTGEFILIGGKAYGDCECEQTTWTLQGDHARRIEHGLRAGAR